MNGIWAVLRRVEWVELPNTLGNEAPVLAMEACSGLNLRVER